MDGPLAASVIAFGSVAGGDWVAVARRQRSLEYVLKPLAMVLLIAAAVLLEPTDDVQRNWFVVALVLSMAGDVFLMLPRDAFIPGLGSFLLAHLAYIAGFAQLGVEGATVILSLAVVGAGTGPLAYRIVGAAWRRERAMGVAVGVYVSAIALMVAMAVASESPTATVGALLFLVSDSMIGWDRFVRPFSHARLAIIVTYHLGQLLLVLSLL